MNKYSDAEMLTALIVFATKHGRPPQQRELRKDGGFQSASTYRYRFGSLTNAILRAGLSPNRDWISKPRKYDDECLLQKLREFSLSLGYVPYLSDLQKAKREQVPSEMLYVIRFGSLEAALGKAGIRFSRLRYKLKALLLDPGGALHMTLSRILRQKIKFDSTP